MESPIRFWSQFVCNLVHWISQLAVCLYCLQVVDCKVICKPFESHEERCDVEEVEDVWIMQAWNVLAGEGWFPPKMRNMQSMSP